MNKKRLRENIENTIYNKFIYACKNEEEFNMFMNGINRYLRIYEDEIEDLEKALKLSCEFNATTTCNGQCQDCLHKEICDNTPKIDFRPIYADYFKKQAKEIMKSE